MTIAFGVRHSERARRVRLTLDGTGRPIVVLPAGTPASVAGEMVGRHRRWIERHQQRIALERSAVADRPALGSGGSIALRGIEHRVVVRAGAAGRRRRRIGIEPGTSPAIVIELPSGVAPDGRGLAALLEPWLRAEARGDLEVAVATRSAEMGVAVTRLAVRDQRTRWGSASRRGTLSFSWRLVLCPAEVLDYVVVHELAHLRWAGHGPRFWALVRRHVPRADKYRGWLRDNKALLRAALD